MQPTNSVTRHYFTPPDDYFWQWSADLDVLEWYDGSTLCFREDFNNVLRGMTDSGHALPPLGALLLVLAACQDSWKSTHRMLEIYSRLSPDGEDTKVDTYSYMAGKMLDLISNLPKELRSGQNRAQLLHELFTNSKSAQLEAETAKDVVALFFSGQVDSILRISREPSWQKLSRVELMAKIREARFRRMEQSRLMDRYIRKLPMDASARFLEDSLPLISAWKKFYKDDTLEQQLRTGLGLPLQPIPLELPEPEPAPIDLLDELASDPETAGIARLTRRLVAAFHIPRHSVGASDLPLGGVSDITNRGDFDRLLLSELAQDDLLLMARLANNEAMFLRREEPPAQPDRRRTLLIDTTLKMWGTPRPFALAAALAVARQVSKSKQATRAFLLGGYNYELADLDNKAGVTAALEGLNPALHCAGSLTEFFSENPDTEDEDCFLISDAEAMQNAEFQRIFSEIKNRIRFVISLKRDGRIDFFEWINGHRKLLSSAHLDLAELMFGEKKRAPRSLPPPYPEARLPKFFTQMPSPLYYPMTSTRMGPKQVFGGFEYTAVVTDQRRVLQWSGFQQGADEMLSCLPSEDYCLGESAEEQISVLVRDPEDMRLQLFVGNPAKKHTWPLIFKGKLQMTFDFGRFYIFHEGKVYSVNFGNYALTEHTDMEGFISANFDPNRFNQAKQMANKGYSTLQRADHIYVGPNGKLVLGQYLLRSSADHWRPNEFWSPGEQDKDSRTEVFTLPSNPRVRLYRRIWRKGGEAIVDGRGLLHLRSADPGIPEVCLTLNLQKGIGMWASDGAVAGNPYFTREQLGHISRHDFYECYIKPILLGILDAQY